MPSDSHNLTMAKAMGSLFDVTLAQEVPIAMPLYIQCILQGPHSSLQKVSILWYDKIELTKLTKFTESVNFDGFNSYVTEIVCNFHSDTVLFTVGDLYSAV